ncbi:MAG: flagellar basal-body MS-ring/collar protein FliF [Vulcanimicrobiaceae bacterium]
MDRVASTWNDLAGRVNMLWQRQTRQGRMIAGTGLSVLVLALAGLGYLYFGRGPTYGVLFSNLTSSDASKVIAHLQQDKVPFRLSASGKTIFVPEPQLAQERVAIAGSGVVSGGIVGYELFDKTNFGMTRFQERIDKTRAIQGELERTIDGLSPVQASRVHIATPSQSLYSNTQEPATASIAITTKPGQRLSSRQVRGITMLVAGAVAGLKPINVTIIDQNGNILLPSGGSISNSGSSSTSALNLTQEQLLAKERYEASLQQSIQSMLDDTLGPHRAVARVSTKMNFDANSVSSKIYAPQGTVLSSQTQREAYTGTQPALKGAVGVPGTTSNIGTYQALAASPTRGRYNKSKTTSNYDISVNKIKHIDAPGKVLQTSVAVLVNSSPASTVAGKLGVQPYQLTPVNVAQIRAAVIAAAGLNLAQGDQISVEAIPFNPALSAPATVAPTTTVLGVPLWALLALLGVAGLAFVGLLVSRSSRSRWRPSAELPSFDSSLTDELPPFEEHPMLDGAPGLTAPIRSAADLTREQMIEYVTTVAQENPESIGKLVKLWLAE